MAYQKISRLAPRYGNISYDILQDIELAVIAVKEIKFLLSGHYRCYYNNSGISVGDQITEFNETEYHDGVIEPTSKARLCSVMRGIVSERNDIIHKEGIDFLLNRKRFINQCMDVFENMSPMEGSNKVSPARHSVLVPCPNSQSLLEDLTFIDYEQYEDISIAVKVTKRIDHILREVFRRSGGSLIENIQQFPYETGNIKRKMLQVNAIRNKLLHERHFNNLENRNEFINLSRSIFSNLIDIVDSGLVNQDRGRVNNFTDNLDVDEFSNMSSSNNVSALSPDTTVSTYHIPIHAPTRSPPQTLSPRTQPRFPTLSPLVRDWRHESSRSATTHYEQLPSEIRDDSTIALTFEEVETSTRKDDWNKPVLQEGRKKLEFIPIEKKVKKINSRKEQRMLRRNKRMFKCCKHFCILLLVLGGLALIGVIAKFYF